MVFPLIGAGVAAVAGALGSGSVIGGGILGAVGSALLGSFGGEDSGSNQSGGSISAPRSSLGRGSGRTRQFQAPQGGDTQGAQPANFDSVVGKWRNLIQALGDVSISGEVPKEKTPSKTVSIRKSQR